MPRSCIRSTSRRWPWRSLAWCALAALALAAWVTVYAQEGSGPSGIIDDGSRRVEWQVGGIDIGEHSYSGPDRCWTAPGTVTSTTVTYSGVLRASVPADLVTTASMSAYLLNQTTGEKEEVHWPDAAKGEVGDLGKPGELFHELPFNFSVQVSPGDRVWITANVSECGGICDLVSLCLFFEPAPDTLAGAPKSEPPLTPTDEPGEPASWVGVVVGVGVVGMVAVAGLAAVGGLALRSRRKGTRPAARYILQLSVDHLDLAAGESKPLTITAWRVTPEGGYVPAPEAAINVQPPPRSGVLVGPVAGQGSLQCLVSAAQGAEPGQLGLTIDGFAAGARVTASVAVAVVGGYELEMF
ncbi:MAG: hypothetical protein ACYC5O_18800 [Anaerolineae bacterium]